MTATSDGNKGSLVALIFFYGQILFFGEALKILLEPPTKVRSSSNIDGDIPKKFLQGMMLHGTHITGVGITITFKLRLMIPY